MSQVLIKKERQDIAPLDELPAGAPAAVKCFKATFKTAVKKSSSVEFDVVATITGVFYPNPAKIEQAERQYVEYLDNLYLLSPYVVESQGTVVGAAVKLPHTVPLLRMPRVHACVCSDFLRASL